MRTLSYSVRLSFLAHLQRSLNVPLPMVPRRVTL
ncbi:hypothetical protein [Enterobacter phage 01_vB_Eclo_IJM]|nr:hypothetical protein [Enterobacter phage 01_vB_Eclo_IJM]UZT50480.1 hypothetical protein [Enterobacter phage 04_vB_Eclo_IJM]